MIRNRKSITSIVFFRPVVAGTKKPPKGLSDGVCMPPHLSMSGQSVLGSVMKPILRTPACCAAAIAVATRS